MRLKIDPKTAVAAGCAGAILSAFAGFVVGRLSADQATTPPDRLHVAAPDLRDAGPLAELPTQLARKNYPDRAVPPPPATLVNAGLVMSEEGLEIIRKSEGLRLAAYESGGAWYVGYGHARTAHEGMRVTHAEAERLLRDDVEDAGGAVKASISVAMTQAEYSALTSLAYNLGAGTFARSKLVDRINRGDREGAANALLFYDKAGGKPHEGLARRRALERALFLSAAPAE